MHDINPTLIWTTLVLGLLGLVTALFRTAPKVLFSLIRRQFMVRVEVLNGDRLFESLKIWFDDNDYASRCRVLSASSIPLDHTATLTTRDRVWRLLLTPAPGLHMLKFGGRRCFVYRDRKDITVANGDFKGFSESFAIYFLGRNQERVRELLAEAQKLSEKQKGDRINVYSADLFQNWSLLARLAPRPLDSVILPEGQMERLYSDLQNFLASEEWYHRMAIPFHRGYLFYGPPGSGKSSLTMALASSFELDIYLLNLANLNDAKLSFLLSGIPSHTILLLEDVDSIFTGRESVGKVTFSGLLNALDGIHAKNGVLVFMSTNFIDRLDSALLRPGRIDVKVLFDNATPEQIERLFLRFFPDAQREARLFRERISDKELSMANIQEYLIERRASALRAVEDIDCIAPSIFPHSESMPPREPHLVGQT